MGGILNAIDTMPSDLFWIMVIAVAVCVFFVRER